MNLSKTFPLTTSAAAPTVCKAARPQRANKEFRIARLLLLVSSAYAHFPIRIEWCEIISVDPFHALMNLVIKQWKNHVAVGSRALAAKHPSRFWTHCRPPYHSCVNGVSMAQHGAFTTRTADPDPESVVRSWLPVSPGTLYDLHRNDPKGNMEHYCVIGAHSGQDMIFIPGKDHSIHVPS